MAGSSPSPPPASGSNNNSNLNQKRSVRACLTCRKTKNRCSGTFPCERCKRLSKQCVFDRSDPEDPALMRVEQLEAEIQGLKHAFGRLVNRIRDNGKGLIDEGWDPFDIKNEEDGQGLSLEEQPERLRNSTTIASDTASSRRRKRLRGDTSPSPSAVDQLFENQQQPREDSPHSTAQVDQFPATKSTDQPHHPALPNYPAPPHPLQHYRFPLLLSPVPSSSLHEGLAASVPDEGLDLPATAMQTEFEANHSGGAPHINPSKSQPQRMARKRRPPPPNAFPSVVEKGLVRGSVAKALFQLYMETSHAFFPILDSTTDTYDLVSRESPWTLNACLYVACRAQGGSSPPSQLFIDLAEEAHGIARSSLFAITTKTRAVQAMAILSAFSMNAYLPASHAMAMGIEFNLHVPIKMLFSPSSRPAEEEDLALVAGARTWLSLITLHHASCRGSGRPTRPIDDESIQISHLPALTSHTLSNPFDIALAAQVGLVVLQDNALSNLGMFRKQMNEAPGGNVTSLFLGMVMRYCLDVKNAARECEVRLASHPSCPSILPLITQRHFKQAELELLLHGMRGRSLLEALTDSNVRELVLAARQVAQDCLQLILHQSGSLRDAGIRGILDKANHSTLLEAAFCALLVLKVSKVLPDGVDVQSTVGDVRILADILIKTAGAETFGKILWSASNQFASHTASCTPHATNGNANASGSNLPNLDSQHFSHEQGLEVLASAVDNAAIVGYEPHQELGPFDLQDWLAVDNFNINWPDLMDQDINASMASEWDL